MKPTNKSIDLIHSLYIGLITLNDLMKVLGKPIENFLKPYYDGKSRWTFLMEDENGSIFSIYDLEHGLITDENTLIHWYIGFNNVEMALKIEKDILSALRQIGIEVGE